MFEHFDTVYDWEISLYPSAENARSVDTLRKWYASAPELWFWEESQGRLLGLLALVPFTMERVLQLASCEFAELEQEPFLYWRERTNFPQTVFHVYEFYVSNNDYSLALRLFNRAKQTLSALCTNIGVLPLGVSALCVTEAGRKCAIKCGLEMVTKTLEKVNTEITPELRFDDLAPSSKLLRLMSITISGNGKKSVVCPRTEVDAPAYFTYNVFLSHSAKDQDMANRIHTDLQRDRPPSLEVYYAPKSTESGKQWKSQLRDALNNCSELVVLLSQESLNSNWVMLEIGAAWARGIRVTPILIDKHLLLDDIPDFIRDFQLLSYFTDEYDTYVAKVHERGKVLG